MRKFIDIDAFEDRQEEVRAHAGADDLGRPREHGVLGEEDVRHAGRHRSPKDRSQVSWILDIFQQQTARNTLRRRIRQGRPDDRRKACRTHELRNPREKRIGENQARFRRYVFEEAADFRPGEGALARKKRLRYSTALLRRPRDDPANLIRALTCGLSLEWKDFTRWRRCGTPRRCRRGPEYRNSSRYWRSAARASQSFRRAILCEFQTMARNTRDRDRIRNPDRARRCWKSIPRHCRAFAGSRRSCLRLRRHRPERVRSRSDLRERHRQRPPRDSAACRRRRMKRRTPIPLRWADAGLRNGNRHLPRAS